jgi:hypothetical protein
VEPAKIETGEIISSALPLLSKKSNMYDHQMENLEATPFMNVISKQTK